MRKNLLQPCLLIGAFTCTALSATAQLTVHAVTGVVTAINANSNTVHINPEDESNGFFSLQIKPNPSLQFSKALKAASTPAASFTTLHNQVIVFYFGDDANRTAVAFEDLGPGPFVKTLGTFVKVDRHQIIIRIESGEQRAFQIDDKTVGDISEGAVEGKKFDANKGAHVRIIATSSNGVQTALFIRVLTL